MNEDIQGDEAVRHNSYMRAIHTRRDRDISSYQQLKYALAKQLIAGKLIALGRAESPLAPHTVIPSSAWKSLRVSDVYDSIVTETTKSKTQVFDVQIFPLVDSPDVVERLTGRSFAEAFQSTVVDDPQTIALNNSAVSMGSCPIPFGFRQGSYRAVWAVRHGSRIARENSIEGRQNIDEVLRYRKERAAARIASRRFAKLIHLLATGKLIARAIPADGENLVPIPPSIWLNDQICVDLANGDLLGSNPTAGNHGIVLEPIFAGLMLSKPMPNMLSSPEESLAAPIPPKKIVERITGTINAESDCIHWLSDLMRTQPKLHPKRQYWAQAQLKWPRKIAYRGFERAWDQAIRDTGSIEWAASGRRRKSLHP